MVRNLLKCLPLALLLFTVACGGGSGDDANAGPDSRLTTSNGVQAAAIAVNRDSIVAPAGVTIFNNVAQMQTVKLTISELSRKLLQLDSRSGVVNPTAFFTCSNAPDGTVNEPVIDPNANSLSGTITFSNCGFNAFTLDGSIGFFFSTTGGGLTFNNLQISTSGGVLIASVNGSFSTSISSRTDGDLVIDVFMVSGNIAVDAGVKGATIMSGFTQRSEDISNTVTLESTTWETFSFNLNTTVLGGTIRVTTDPASGGSPFITISDDPFPASGRLVLIGQGNSRVHVTAQGDGSRNGLVIIEFDEDGDGIYEDSKTISDTGMTWATLETIASGVDVFNQP